MPVLDGNFEAFVTNLGKYNEGALVGEWVKFPTTEEEMQKVFERIGIGSTDDFGQPYEEWFITDYECPIHGVYDMLGEYESLDKLNYLAARLEEMPEWELKKLVAIMEAGCDEVSDIDDLINLTFNLDCYDFIPDTGHVRGTGEDRCAGGSGRWLRKRNGCILPTAATSIWIRWPSAARMPK